MILRVNGQAIPDAAIEFEMQRLRRMALSATGVRPKIRAASAISNR